MKEKYPDPGSEPALSPDPFAKPAVQTGAPSVVEEGGEESAFARLGGWDGLHRLIADFIGRVYQDPIIGFFFVQVDRERLIEREVGFAAIHLGGPHRYDGRPMARAHKPHPINSGHFHRRLWLLSQTLQDHQVPQDIIAQWLAHNRLLEAAVTDGSDCQ